MFITKKTSPRRTFLRGAGVDARAAVARCDGAAARALAQPRRARRPLHRHLRAARHGPGYWVPETAGARFRVPDHPRAAGAVPRSHGDHERAVVEVGGTASRRDRRRSLGCRGVPVRERSRRRRPALTSTTAHNRSDHRAEDRPGHAVAVAAARRRGSRREFEQLRRGLQLRLHELDLVADADRRCRWSSTRRWCSSACSATAARRGAGRAPRAATQHPRFDHRQLAAFEGDIGAADRARLDEYVEDVREIERRLQIADEGVDGRAADATCRTACRNPSTNTSSCSSICWRWPSRATSRASPRCSTPAT